MSAAAVLPVVVRRGRDAEQGGDVGAGRRWWSRWPVGSRRAATARSAEVGAEIGRVRENRAATARSGEARNLRRGRSCVGRELIGDVEP